MKTFKLTSCMAENAVFSVMLSLATVPIRCTFPLTSPTTFLEEQLEPERAHAATRGLSSIHPVSGTDERGSVRAGVGDAARCELVGVEGKELGLGIVNLCTPEIETVERVISRVRETLDFLPPEAIFLNPDCGFSTFARRPMNETEIAPQKLGGLLKP